MLDTYRIKKDSQIMSEKISVALATYNGEKYILKLLETLMGQTVSADEVIICDDNSTDNTRDLVKKFVSYHNLRNWKVFHNSNNVGYKKNFYKCIQYTSGDYIFLCDQDDEWLPSKIEKMISVMKMNKFVKTLSCGVSLIDENSNIRKIKKYKNYYNSNLLYLDHEPKKIEKIDSKYICKHNISPGCTLCMTKEVKDAFLESYDFTLPHDWFINMISASKQGCFFLNEALLMYRTHERNTIGAQTRFSVGVKTRTRKVRIEDYRYRILAIQHIMCQNDDSKKYEDIVDIYKQLIEFYSKPNLKRKMDLCFNKEYREITKRKIRAWEWIVAMGLDTVIERLL